MAYKIVRKIISAGNSKCISLPKPWLDLYCPQTVTIFYDDIIVVAPPGLEWKAKKILEAAGRLRK